ncbi:MAG: hypothetical protein V1837_00070 [Candidatus Woesearchaeota archaeon]
MTTCRSPPEHPDMVISRIAGLPVMDATKRGYWYDWIDFNSQLDY